MFLTVVLAMIGAAGYVGYTIYTEQQEKDEAERQRGVTERNANREQANTEKLIEILQDTPRWNGPGAPTFGVGEGEADVESVILVEP